MQYAQIFTICLIQTIRLSMNFSCAKKFILNKTLCIRSLVVPQIMFVRSDRQTHRHYNDKHNRCQQNITKTEPSNTRKQQKRIESHLFFLSSIILLVSINFQLFIPYNVRKMNLMKRHSTYLHLQCTCLAYMQEQELRTANVLQKYPIPSTATDTLMSAT